MVFDSVIAAIGVEKIEITASMVYYAMNALSWYKDELKGMKQEENKRKRKADLKKGFMEQEKELKTMKLNS